MPGATFKQIVYSPSLFTGSGTINFTPTAPGNLIVVWIDIGSTSTTVSSVVDNNSVPFNNVILQTTGGSSRYAYFDLLNCEAGISSITITLSNGGTSFFAAIFEYSFTNAGYSRQNVYGSNLVSPGTGANALTFTTGSVTTPVWCIGVCGSSVGSEHSFSSGTGWNQEAANNGSQSPSILVQDQEPGASGTVVFNATTSIGTNGYAMVVAAYSEVTSAIPTYGPQLGVLGPGLRNPFNIGQFRPDIHGFSQNFPTTTGLIGITALGLTGFLGPIESIMLGGVSGASSTGNITAFITVPPVPVTTCICIASPSGTVSQTVYETRVLIDKAYLRCGLRPQQIDDEMIDRANWAFYLILSDMVNTGSPVWTYEKVLISQTQGLAKQLLPPGTVDIRNAFQRKLSILTPDSAPALSASSASWSFQALGGATVNTLAINWTTIPVPISIQYSNVGPTGPWTTASNHGVPPAYVMNSALPATYWYDVDGANAATFWQIVPQVSAATLGISSLILGTNPNDILMARLNQDDYELQPNKQFQGPPLQYWMDRQLQPNLRLWPTPNLEYSQYPIVVWRSRYLQDVGSMTQTMEAPQYWYEALTWKLASVLIWETPEADLKRAPALETKAAEVMRLAWNQDRDKAPIRLRYNTRAYTA